MQNYYSKAWAHCIKHKGLHNYMIEATVHCASHSQSISQKINLFVGKYCIHIHWDMAWATTSVNSLKSSGTHLAC